MATGVSKNKWDESDVLPENFTNFPIQLNYSGKKSEHDILDHLSPQYISPYQRGSKKRLYWGDNLNVLSTLIRDKEIAGNVELIYIDPPFATGGVFQSRRTQENAYTDLLIGAEYIEFLRHRLVFLRELLSETGSIYVHLDANMVFAIKLIMDEIFGENKFRSLISRKKCNPKNYTRKTYGNITDFILFYTKSNNYTWNRSFEPWTKEDADKEYQYIDEKTGRRYKKVPVHAPGIRNGKTGKPWRGMMPPPGKHWQYTPDTLDQMDERGEIYWSPTGNPRRKIFFDDSLGKPVQDIWLDVKDAHNQNIQVTGYPTEKNPLLLERIIKASSNPGDIVLDCFCGSGTSLAVSEQLSRNWIGADNSLHAISTTLKRFVVGTEVMGDFVTKKETLSNPSQLSLFDNNGGSIEYSKNEANAHQPITDFTFLCEKGLEKQLTKEFNEWIEAIEFKSNAAYPNMH